MSPTGRQNVNQYLQQHRQQSRVPDTAPYPSASQRQQRHSNSPSTSSMASSRTRRESSIGQQSDTRDSDISPTPEGHRVNEANIEGQTQSIDLVGQPILFTTGQFAGCTIRMVLQEIQKADLGRKYARVDRRPLDPPPVVLLRLYMIHNYGTSEEYEVELNYDDVQDLGLLCTVDLFPVPPPDAAYQGSSSSPDALVPSCYPSDSRAPRRRTPPSAPPVLSSFPLADPLLRGQRDGYHIPQEGLVTQFQNSGPSELAPPPDSTGTTSGSPSHFAGVFMSVNASQDVVYYHNGFPIVEGSKETASLVGQTFIQPITIDYMGNKAIVFAFTDLAVKIEGTFILRYRVFDIFSRPSSHNHGCISAETYGGMFRVYSTKDFPGLSKSTELTKHLARYGLRVNIRETERKRRRKSGNGDRSDTYSDS